jgi:hypothetical protein
LPSQAAELSADIDRRAGQKIKLNDLGREIKKEKKDNSIQVSTDVSPACGGYDGAGIIYEIEFSNLFWNKGGTWSQAGNPVNPGLINPCLVMDAEGPGGNPTVVAVAIGGQAGTEVAFLTSIPKRNIKRYKTGNGAWTPTGW